MPWPPPGPRPRRLPVPHLRRRQRRCGKPCAGAWAEGGPAALPADPMSLDCPPGGWRRPGEPVVVKPRLVGLLRHRSGRPAARTGHRHHRARRHHHPQLRALDGPTTGWRAASTSPSCEDATSSRSPEAQEANLADMEAAGIQLIPHRRLRGQRASASATPGRGGPGRGPGLEAKARNTETDAAAIRRPQMARGLPCPYPGPQSIETVSTGWINKYHLHYTLPDGRPTYEGVSARGPSATRPLWRP